MMAIQLADGFRQYVDAADIKNRLVNDPTKSSVTIVTNTGPFGKYGVHPSGGASNAVYHHGSLKFKRPGGNINTFNASVDLKIGADGAAMHGGSICIGISPLSYENFNHATVTGAVAFVAGISLEIDELNATVYHSIITAVNSATGVPTVNKSALGVFPKLVAAQSYTVEMQAKILSATSGEAIVRINGQQMSVAFNPTRVTPAAGLEQSGGFCMMMIGARSQVSPTLSFWISDVVIYDNDAATSWPLGPIDITYLAADDPDLAVGPASDLTYETVSGEVIYQIADPAAGEDIVGGIAYARVAAIGGSVATSAQLELVNGASVVTVANEVIQPGYTSSIKAVPVSKEMIANSSVFRARSVAP